MTQAQLAAINFHGRELFVTEHNNEPFAPMKPIVEGMGLAWGSQQQKLTANRERWGILIIDIPTTNGVYSKMLCMPLRKLPAFFASISVNKVREELRATIILFQNECDDALWKYWTGQQVQRECKPVAALPSPSDPITPDQQCTLQNMVKALVDKGGVYANIWSRFNNHFRLGSYKQLPQAHMGDAIAYLMQLEIAPKVLPEPEPTALPPGRVPAEDEIERQLGRIHEAINTMRDAEGKIYDLARTMRSPVMRDLDARRAIAIQLHYANEEMFYMMDRAVNSIRHHVTALAMSGRM